MKRYYVSIHLDDGIYNQMMDSNEKFNEDKLQEIENDIKKLNELFIKLGFRDDLTGFILED